MTDKDYSAICGVYEKTTIVDGKEINRKEEEHGLKVVGAVYHLESGSVDFDIKSQNNE